MRQDAGDINPTVFMLHDLIAQAKELEVRRRWLIHDVLAGP
jgi:hypothetical protein